MSRTILQAVFCTCISICTYGQDISGRWEGQILGINNKAPGRGGQPSFVVDLTLDNDSVVRGTSMSGQFSGRHKYYSVSGIFHKADSTLYLQQDSAISIDRGGGTDNKGYYRLKLHVEDGRTMVLQGKWKPYEGMFGTSRIWLRKSAPNMLETNTALPARDRNLNREERLVSRITVGPSEKDSIRIELLDNNRVDNDVVSVYLNDSLVIRRHTITHQPFAFFVSLSQHAPVCRLKIAAESTGTEPPCTALVTVSTKAQSRQIDLASTLAETGVIEIVLKP